MATKFEVILEDFDKELLAINSVVEHFSAPANGNPRERVAAVNAATLFLAATFEEFIREMARAYARTVVESCDSFERLPNKFATVAWKRAMDSLSRQKVGKDYPIELKLKERFDAAFEFCRGDLSKDIYDFLIHNENNMRPSELNSMFKISGLRDVCYLVCDKEPLLSYFKEDDPSIANGLLIEQMENFFKRRNQIAHSINSMRSSGPDLISKNIALFWAFGSSLAETLEHSSPPPCPGIPSADSNAD